MIDLLPDRQRDRKRHGGVAVPRAFPTLRLAWLKANAIRLFNGAQISEIGFQSLVLEQIYVSVAEALHHSSCHTL